MNEKKTEIKGTRLVIAKVSIDVIGNYDLGDTLEELVLCMGIAKTREFNSGIEKANMYKAKVSETLLGYGSPTEIVLTEILQINSKEEIEALREVGYEIPALIKSIEIFGVRFFSVSFQNFFEKKVKATSPTQ